MSKQFDTRHEQEQKSRALKIVELANNIATDLSNLYMVPIPQPFVVGWGDKDFSFGQSEERVAWIQSDVLYLSRSMCVTFPSHTALRNTPVKLEVGFPDGKYLLTVPYGRLLDLLFPPIVKTPFLPESNLEKPLSDLEIKVAITKAIVFEALSVLQGWLATDCSEAICLRNGIVACLNYFLCGISPVDVSFDHIWRDGDPQVKAWRESEGGFQILMPVFESTGSYLEVVKKIEESGPPMLKEKLPTYIKRIFPLRTPSEYVELLQKMKV